MREAHLVQVEKSAQKRLYQINPKTVTELEVWIKKLRGTWNERLDILDKVLAAEKKKLLKIKRKDKKYGK